MQLLVLVQNLEINRTSSGLRSHKHLILYKKIFKEIDVITSTPNEFMHELNGIDYYHIEKNLNNNTSWYNHIPKSVALQNFCFGFEINEYKIIKKWINKANSLLQTKSYDLVISLDTGSSFHAAYALHYLKKKAKFKHLMFVHDPFPLNQYPPPFKKKNSLPYRSISNFFGKVIKTADIVSFPSLMLMESMNKFYPGIHKKYFIQPHIGMPINDLRNFLPEQKSKKLPTFDKGINIVHTGSLLKERDPNFIIQGLNLLFKNHPETKNIFKLHIIGKINKHWNQQKIASNNILVYSKRFTYLESLEIHQNADVLLLLEAVSDISPIMMGKLADYLLADKPILALTPNISETTRILGTDYPLLVENGNIHGIYSKLLKIYNCYKNESLQTLLPKKTAKAYVSKENWIENLTQLII